MATYFRPVWAALSLAALTGACGREQTQAGSGRLETSAPASSEAGYLAPPRITSAGAGHEGMVRVAGRAPPHWSVALVSPEGEETRAPVDRNGRWAVQLPGDRLRLYAVSAALGGRTLHAEGALVTAPGALSPAVIVRAGSAALPLVQAGRTDIATVDYDPSGGIAVAGRAPAHAALSLMVDGVPAAAGQAGPDGRYALLAANRRLPLGPHRLVVRLAGGVADRQVDLAPPAALTAPYRAWPTADGWRVEWALNGGGVQTTLILKP